MFLSKTADGELSHLSQDPLCRLLELVALSLRGKELSQILQSVMCVLGKGQLRLDDSLKRRVQVRHARVDNLWQLRGQLGVHGLVHLAQLVGLMLGPRELGRVLRGLFDKLADLGPGGVVVKQLLVPALDRLVDLGEVGRVAADGL